MSRLSIFGSSIVYSLIFRFRGGSSSKQQAFTTPGTYTWVAPAGITSVSVVCVGGGGGAGGVSYYSW
jgi:hypothetical protein